MLSCMGPKNFVVFLSLVIFQIPIGSLHRLVVRTSRCGRDNPCSTPGEDMYALAAHVRRQW